MEHISSHPVHLFIGDHQALLGTVERLLQTMLCAQKGCTYCSVCRRIRDQQHAQIMWVAPEKQYTLECIEPILQLLSLQRDTQERYYIVLQHADFLTNTCANALLKSLEEPPRGYQFILLAASEQMVLPTIRSRCVVHTVHASASVSKYSKLYDHFTQRVPLPAAAFLKLLDEYDLNERESIQIVTDLLGSWRTAMHNAIQHADTKGRDQALHMMHLLGQAVQQPPMPGSSKLFWKNLFLRII